MKYHNLEIENWRCFHGEHVVNFSSDEKRNITLIFGHNGGGKTAVINAMAWLFYGEVHPSFENPHELINFQAIQDARVGDRIQTTVACVFTHQNVDYTATRIAEVKKLNAANETTTLTKVMFEIVGDDKRRRDRSAELFFEEIIPKTVKDFFFCNAETVKNLFDTMNGEDDLVEKSLKDWFKISLLQEIKQATDKNIKSLSSRIKKTTDNSELRDLHGDLEGLKDEKGKMELKRETHRVSAELKKKQRDEVNRQLQKIPDAEELAKERERLEQRVRSALDQMESISRLREDNLRRLGIYTLIRPAAQMIENEVGHLREKDMLPVKIRSTFCDALLSEKKCICDRHLNDGSDARNAVLTFQQQYGQHEHAEAIATLHMESKATSQNCVEFKETLSKLVKQDEQVQHQRQLDKLALEEVNQKLGGVNEGEIKQLNDKSTALEKEYLEEIQAFERCESLILSLEERIKLKEKDITGKEVQDANARKLQIQFTAATDLSKALDEYYQIRRSQVQTLIGEKITKLWKEHVPAKAHLVAKCDKSFNITITTEQGQEPGLAAGEKLVLAFFFIASIIEIQSSKSGPESTTSDVALPVFIDAPFSVLGNLFREETSKLLPQITNQLILTLLDSQFYGNEENLEPKTQHAYVVALGKVSNRETGPNDILRWRGGHFELVSESAPPACSCIIEITDEEYD